MKKRNLSTLPRRICNIYTLSNQRQRIRACPLISNKRAKCYRVVLILRCKMSRTRGQKSSVVLSLLCSTSQGLRTNLHFRSYEERTYSFVVCRKRAVPTELYRARNRASSKDIHTSNHIHSDLRPANMMCTRRTRRTAHRPQIKYSSHKV